MPFLQMVGAIILFRIVFPSATPLLVYSLPKVVLAVAVFRTNKLQWKCLEGFDRTALKASVPLILGLFGLKVIVQSVLSFTLIHWPMPDFFSGHDVASDLGASGLMVLAFVIGPILEEVAFRGGFLQVFLKRYSTSKAVLLSALLFAIYHLNPWQFCGALLFGIALGWVYLRTRSIILCSLAHTYVNALPTLFRDVLRTSIPGFTSFGELQPVWFTTLGVAAALVGAIMFQRVSAQKVREAR